MKCRLELLLGILNSTFIRPVKTDLWHLYYSFFNTIRYSSMVEREDKKKKKKFTLEMRNLEHIELQ